MLRNGLEPWHLLIVAVVVIVLFGSKRLPDAARSLGKSMRILKSETKAMKDDDGAASPATAPSAADVRPTPRTVTAAPGNAASAHPTEEHRSASAVGRSQHVTSG